MKSNDELRAKARELRSGGMSILKIVKELKVPKSTIFGWIRDVVLTEEQRKSLSRSESGALKKAIETVKKNRVDRWNVYRIEADKEWEIMKNDPLFMFGLALYIGEGAKVSNSEVNIVNANVSVIWKAMLFFEKIGIKQDEFKIQIHVHVGADEKAATDYWIRELGLPRSQFQKTIVATSIQRRGIKGNILPNGTCHLRNYSTRIKQKVLRWMELALE
jgi:hypothetical protein